MNLKPSGDYASPVNDTDTVLLAELEAGEFFQFAQRRLRKMTVERIPQWKVIRAGTEYCEVALDAVSPISSGPSERSTRLSGTTLVRRVSSVHEESGKDFRCAQSK